MAKMQVFTYENLLQYDPLIKGYVNDAIGDSEEKSLKTISITGNTVKFYKIDEPVGDSEPAYTLTLPDTSGLMAKLTGATVGNVVTVAADGEVADGGVALADLATKEEVGDVSDLVGVIPDGYEATTIAEYAKELADNVAANGYDDTELSGKVTANTEAIEELDGEVGDLTTLTTTEKTSIVGAINEVVGGKADKATTIAGYGITDAYTKTEVDGAITTAVANAEHLKRSIVDTLPEVADADAHTIYMVSITDGTGNQKYEEFMLINDAFEKIGDSAVDLTDYATKSYVDGLNTAMDTRVTTLEGLVGEGYEPISSEAISNLFS